MGTAKATATGTSLNRGLNIEQCNGCAGALSFLVHFFAVLCKTTGTLPAYTTATVRTTPIKKRVHILLSNFAFT